MIGIFDSGSGGLTVLKAIRKRAPRADVVYFGDLKNAPYGEKSREELGALTVLGIRRLIDEGATEIVSACNSVSVSIVLPMFDILKLPRTHLIEMVGPTLARFRGSGARALVLATQATIDSRAYEHGLRLVGCTAEGVAVTRLVAELEEGAGDAVLRAVIRDTLAPIDLSVYTHIVLACTHYPLVRHLFEQVVFERGAPLTIFDPADAVAEDVCVRFDVEGQGTTRFIVSKQSEVFERYARAALSPHTERGR